MSGGGMLTADGCFQSFSTSRDLMELFSGSFVSNYNKITLLDAFFEKLSSTA